MSPPRTLLLVSTALLAGCATLPPARPVAPGDAATLVPELRLGRRVRIVEVDGRSLGLFRDRAGLAPGRHEVLAHTGLLVRGRAAQAFHRLEFDAAPGRSYRVRSDWHAYGPRIWIEDAESGERIAVAVTRPPRLPQVGAR